MGPSQASQHFIYGEDDPSKQVVHVVEPEPRHRPRPAVVLFHGGGPSAGTPLQDMDWAGPIAEQGYVAFMAGYRLFHEETGANPWPAQLQDARRVIRWIRAEARRFDVDPGRICALGHSSGGHLAGLLGTTEGPIDNDGRLAGISSRVDCVVTLSGDADLLVPYPDPQTTESVSAWFGGTVADVPAVWLAASPAHNVDEYTVPFLVIHGQRDEAVPVEMARNLVAALAANGVEHVYAELDAGHMDITSREEVLALWWTFLADQLHPER